jgi:hypothetical protein
MPRNRLIKSDMWADEKIGNLSMTARLLFIGAWNFCDDSGVCRAKPVYLRNNIFPYDEELSIKDVQGALTECAVSGLVLLVDYESESFLIVKNFLKHQTINRPSTFRYIPSNKRDSVTTQGGLSEGSLTKGKDKVNGKDKEKVNLGGASTPELTPEEIEERRLRSEKSKQTKEFNIEYDGFWEKVLSTFPNNSNYSSAKERYASLRRKGYSKNDIYFFYKNNAIDKQDDPTFVTQFMKIASEANLKQFVKNKGSVSSQEEESESDRLKRHEDLIEAKFGVKL